MEEEKQNTENSGQQDESCETNEQSQKEQSQQNSEQNIDYRTTVNEMSDEELEKLFTRAKDADFYRSSIQRTQADYENYQKRMERERTNIYKYANQNFATKLLDVLDYLEMAITSATDSVEKNFFEGICLVQKEFNKVLKEFQVEPIEAIGKRFNPEYHEAIQQQETDDHPDMTVLHEVKKGYMLNDRLLRAASVVVSRKPKSPEPAADENSEQ